MLVCQIGQTIPPDRPKSARSASARNYCEQIANNKNNKSKAGVRRHTGECRKEYLPAERPDDEDCMMPDRIPISATSRSLAVGIARWRHTSNVPTNFCEEHGGEDCKMVSHDEPCTITSTCRTPDEGDRMLIPATSQLQ